MDTLVAELLDRYSPPPDLEEILAEPEYSPVDEWMVFTGIPGDVVQGFNVPGFVERVTVPKELDAFVTVEEIRSEYNISRGEVTMYQVRVDPILKLERMENSHAVSDGHEIATYSFFADGRKYKMLYDTGTRYEVATFTIAELE